MDADFISHDAGAPAAGRRAAGGLLGVLALAVAVALMILGVPTRDDSLQRLRDGQPLRIGYAAEAPYAFVDEGGHVTGEGPILARRVAEALGVQRVEWVQTSFASLVPDLLDARFDVVAAGLFITPERQAVVAFSLPTFRVGAGILHRGEGARLRADCKGLAAVSELRLAVLEGAVEGPRLAACGVPPARLLLVPDAATGQAAVRSGLVDGLVLSEPTVRWMARYDPSGALRTRPVSLDPANPHGRSEGAFAFRPADRALREAWDRVLLAFLGGPEHLAELERFGFQAADLARPPTAAEGR
ncbi:transporter substrate-binding domain-containing protein [Myxococcota bacterium]|nr:transporter substrate-binding domain-containing protein [Myxococcota bacterium]